MRIEPCPSCGRKPKIEEWNRDKYGNRRWFIGCPNYCWVLKSQHYLCGWGKDHGIYYIGNADRNTLYKLWNEAIKESKDAQV